MSGKPAFLYCDYTDAATATATDSLSGTDPSNVLLATEDTVWSPANATGEKAITITDSSVMPIFDVVAILGENLEGVDLVITNSAGSIIQSEGETVADPFLETGVGWTFGTGWVWSGAATQTAIFSGAVIGDFSQTITVEQGKYYRANVFVGAISDADLEVKLGTVTLGTITTTGISTFTFLATASMVGDLVLEANNLGATPAVTVNTAQVVKYQTLSPVNNVSIIYNLYNSTGLSKDTSVFVIRNPSTALQIAHICPDTLVLQPWLEEDWGSEGIAPVFNNLTSTGGLFLGNNQVRTMRDISINFGEVTDTEFDGTIKPWVDSRILVAKPFFFLPDSDNSDEIYFVWLEDNVGLTAPLKLGIRNMSPIAAKTRID